MDILIGLSYAIGVAALFGSLNAYYSGNKLHALWWVAGGLIWLILTGAWQIHRYILASETISHPDLERPNLVSPKPAEEAHAAPKPARSHAPSTASLERPFFAVDFTPVVF